MGGDEAGLNTGWHIFCEHLQFAEENVPQPQLRAVYPSSATLEPSMGTGERAAISGRVRAAMVPSEVALAR